MGIPFTVYARRFLVDPKGAAKALDCPVLVWQAPPSEAHHDESLSATQAGKFAARPRAGEPLVFEVKKMPSKLNAFALGVTIGRTDNNDVVVVDSSVSRFHAFLQQDAKGWKVVDAESLNGTWVGGTKVEPNKSLPLPDKSALRVGDIELTFFSPSAFAEFVQQKLK